MTGKVVLIGAGPGDPMLLTLRGKKYIEQADCIVYDRLASSELLAYAKKDCELIYVGKENHHHTMKQEDINQLLVKEACNCKLIVRLKGGDPYVFGRGGEEALFLKNMGIEVEVVPGISSVIATLEDAGIPITHRGLSKGFQVVTAHSRKDMPADIDYSKMLDTSITYLFLMGLSHVREIAQELIKAGRDKNTPVAVISNGTTARQRKCVGNLDNIYELVLNANLVSPAIIVVGDVVTLSDKLDFFESRPLFGRRYIVPYIERFCFSYDKGVESAKKQEHFDSELEMKLRDMGADICPVKVGKIVPINIQRDVFEDALKSDWIIFTSQNGVNAFLWNLKEKGLDIRAISSCKIAVVGRKTGEALAKVALCANVVPKKQTGEELCKELDYEIAKSGIDKSEVRVTLFVAKESNEEVDKYLSDMYNYTKIICYENRIEKYVSNEYNDIEWNSYDGIFFTSGSSVKRIINISKGELPDKIYSIGPKCSEVIRSETGRKCIEAQKSDYDGLLHLVI